MTKNTAVTEMSNGIGVYVWFLLYDYSTTCDQCRIRLNVQLVYDHFKHFQFRNAKGSVLFVFVVQTKQRVSTYWKLDFKLRLIIECNTYCKLLYSGMCFLSMSICLIDDKKMEEIRSEW